MAMIQYAEDHNGYAPNGLNLSNFWMNWGWYIVTYGYMPSQVMIHCPSANPPGNWFHTYGYRDRQQFTRILSKESPSTYYMLCDSSRNFNLLGEAPNFFPYYNSWENHYFTLRHAGRGNLSFLDCHVETLDETGAAGVGINYTFNPE